MQIWFFCVASRILIRISVMSTGTRIYSYVFQVAFTSLSATCQQRESIMAPDGSQFVGVWSASAR